MERIEYLTRVSQTRLGTTGRPRPWRSKLPSELRDDWWQIEAREASRGPGPRLRLSNQYQRAGASHVPRFANALSERCVSSMVCDLQIWICWPVTEERVPGPSPYVIDHDRGHEGCSKFCGLRGISVAPGRDAATCVAQQLRHEWSYRGPEFALVNWI